MGLLTNSSPLISVSTLKMFQNSFYCLTDIAQIKQNLPNGNPFISVSTLEIILWSHSTDQNGICQIVNHLFLILSTRNYSKLFFSIDNTNQNKICQIVNHLFLFQTNNHSKTMLFSH